MAERLDQLIRQGVSHIATFVPWQAVESDITHMLPRFLQALAERKMTVSLLLTPEVGVHFPNSGLPKDLISRKEDAAQGQDGLPLSVTLPPNSFPLPSLFAPDFNKRYSSFLARMDSLLGDLGRTQPHLVEGVTVVVTGSFWKYYRTAGGAAGKPFAGPAGDYSSKAALAFCQCVEQFYSQREFLDPHPLAANRWKARNMDDVNRRWFYQQSEDVFRNRTFHLLRKKAPFVRAQEIELYTPEADPGFAYSHFLQMLSGGHADVGRLSAILDEAASRATFAAESRSAPVVNWSSLGGFRSLADPEKQFLLLKSLLLMGGQGGGVLVDEQDWFSLSNAFRSRVDGLAKLIAHQQLRLATQAVFLASHTWSPADPMWEELRRQLGPAARLVSSMEWVLQERGARLLIVDPSVILTREVVFKLSAWTKSGRVVLMPHSTLFTEAAKRELEQTVGETRRIDVNLGIPYHLHMLGDGKLIVYELPDGAQPASWQALVSSAMALAGIETGPRANDSRISLIPLQKDNQELGLFVLNETHSQVNADLSFPERVALSDFAAAFTPDNVAPARAQATVLDRISLELAPCGVLSLAVAPVAGREAGTGVAEKDRRIEQDRGELRKHGIDL